MERLKLFGSCLGDRFWLHLGDLSTIGLAQTAFYIVACLLMLQRMRRGGWLPRERLLWGVCTVIVLLMTINTQLDLQQTLFWTGRCMARAEGWFDRRHEIQEAFGLALLVAGTLVALALIWTCRIAIRANFLLMLGMGLLLAFVVLQIARFEQLTGHAAQPLIAPWLRRLVEGAGLLALIGAALRRSARP